MPALLIFATALLGQSVHYQYEGQIASVKVNNDSPTVHFTIHYFMESPTSETVYWLLETPTGTSHVTERFGSFERRGDSLGSPQLPYERPENRHLISIESPWLLFGKDLANTPNWKDGDQSVTAEYDSSQKAYRVAWSAKYGRRKGAVVADGASPIRSYLRTLFFGQGVEHRLQWKLAKTLELKSEEFESATSAIRTMQPWRETPPNADDMQNNLAALNESAAWQPLVQFLKVGDCRNERSHRQRQRGGAID